MTAFTFSDPDVTMTTGHEIAGKEVVEYRGVVVVDVTPGRHIGKDLASGLRDIVGGRSASWENTLAENQREALRELAEEAKAQGANALVGVHIEDETVGASGGMMNMKAVGTAVVVE